MQSLRAYYEQLQATLPAHGPGFSAVVLRHDQVAFELHHGLASLELKVPLSGDSAYYFASESKQFTAACVLTLVRAGALSLDDDVCPLLPELAKFEQAFPLRSLLNHSSGIPDYFQFIACQLGRHEADYFDNRYILQIISRCDTVDFPTSTDYGYSNSNYILLATLVARLTGTSLGHYARKTLFEPLGIHALGYDEDRFSIIDHRVVSYEADPARPCGYRQHLANANTVGDGGVVGSTNAMLRWEREWHRQWADQSSLLHAMLQESPLQDGRILSYRFGLEKIRHQDQDVVFHSGGLWGFNTLVLRLPQLHMSIIHLANCEAAEDDMQGLLDAVLD
jgi:CubicO group peptidase (beta-lactamase class C family)